MVSSLACQGPSRLLPETQGLGLLCPSEDMHSPRHMCSKAFLFLLFIPIQLVPTSQGQFSGPLSALVLPGPIGSQSLSSLCPHPSCVSAYLLPVTWLAEDSEKLEAVTPPYHPPPSSIRARVTCPPWHP